MVKTKHIFKYTEEQLQNAVEAVKSGGMSLRKAACQYNIPRGTLFDKVKGRTPLKRKFGRDPYLTESEEKAIVE